MVLETITPIDGFSIELVVFARTLILQGTSFDVLNL